MKNYLPTLLVVWIIVMLRMGYIIPRLISENPMIPFLIVTFVFANFFTGISLIAFEGIKFVLNRD